MKTPSRCVPLCLLVVLLLCSCSEEGGLADGGSAPGQEAALLGTRVAELEAREAIRELFADYGRTLDERNYAAFAALFTDEAVYGGGGGTITQGAEAIAAQLENVISANASGANLHVYSNEKIDIDIESGTATAVSRGAFYVQNDSGGPMPLMFATYVDELVEEDGRWKFRSRQVTGDIPGPSNESRAAGDGP